MKGRFIDPSEVARAYRDPLSWASLAVDVLPILAVIAFSWGPTPLVALYWLENLVIGLFTIARMVGSAMVNILNLGMALFMAPFFFFHYGAFCYGHGIFLNAFAAGGGDLPEPLGLVNWAAGTAPEMIWFVGAIVAVNLAFLVFDFFGRGEFKTTNPGTEMFAPYGRIVTLHIAIILGAALAFSMDEPLLGVLLLILIRVVFGIVMTVLRRRRRDARVTSAASMVDDDA